ncbi:hypothetical protein [Pontibacter mangrovi]|uniref:Uncharacterized protein n=1 Tax=Pontibacter mangrovi TaxID=2589816 RepID=A0A501WFS0_9BACT|nr:hypothetical protein [Pontibacter mangrovi]TPE44376.1 hypothetical protein FJM65_09505 [Pontibacter mangrovi]
MNRLVFILSFVLLIAFYVVWGQLEYPFGGFLVVVGTLALIYFRRRYLGMRPYWAGKFSDIPKYFKLP